MDAAREYTDREIRRVARDLAMDYGREGETAASKVLDFLTERAVDGVVPESALQGRDWARLRSEVARQMSDRNRASAEAVGGRMGTVRDLTAGDAPAESRVPHPAIDRRRDLTWNERHVEAAARAAVGRDPSVAARGVRDLADMNRNAAVRKARTAINGAENAGRMDAMLARGGSKRWVAVMDERTRVSHASINGEVVPVDRPFSNGLMYPGDPSGPPEEVYNCRCTMEWVAGDGSAQVVDGRDLLGTWERRPDQFDFDIDDVIDAQGFNGLPRVVDADEFDRAVQAANGGDGLIMQRAYSAPDRETLDSYRDQLYSGRWYVDCSVGGAEYGKGMYCAGDWAKSLSDKTVTSMRHYAGMHGGLSNVETMTLDPTARVIKTSDLMRESAKARSSVVDSIAADVVEESLDMSGMGDLREAERRYLTDLAVGRRPSVSIDPERYGMSVDDMDEFGEYLRGLTNERASFDDRIARLDNMDEGVLAAALGYDAIDVRGQGYVVVLNRTKLIIRRPE